MTEQEKREKVIKEIAEITTMRYCNDDICDLYNDNCVICEATRLYDAGYRKVDEVRKEFFDKLIETFVQMTAYGSDCNQHTGYYDNSIKVGDVIETIKEIFGVEVEE